MSGVTMTGLFTPTLDVSIVKVLGKHSPSLDFNNNFFLATFKKKKKKNSVMCQIKKNR